MIEHDEIFSIINLVQTERNNSIADLLHIFQIYRV